VAPAREDKDVNSYVRPSIDAPVFRDAGGHVIDYGNRWVGLPPEDSYSVDTHPERFAPIHTVAEALIAHLRDTYDVELVESVDTAGDLLHPAPEVVRAVRVRPYDPACAALTFVFTAYPGIFLHAGLLHDFHYPFCGCDACDSTWEAEADELERHVLAVITGHYREAIHRGLRPWAEYALTYPDGASSGGYPTRGIFAERVKAATALLGRRFDAWDPWPHTPSNH
jgi:hypothetical protein